MATVHLGRLLGPVGFARTVAIKCLHPNFAKDPEFSAMFLDEARVAARIRHPSVVQTLDVVKLHGELFLVMDYVHGESFARLLSEASRRKERVTPQLIVPIIVSVLHGLHAAHEATDERGQPLGIVHRDVSPHNVIVGVDGVARVLDFGVAKAAGRLQETRAGQLKGKIPYMAPEQVGGTVTRSSDIYACSVVLWEALAGRRLFKGESEVAIIAQVTEGNIPLPTRFARDLPRELEAITMRGLARDPASRFQSARDMARALEKSVQLATATEIGEWVERLAGEGLATRAGYVKEMERDSLEQAPPPSGSAPNSAEWAEFDLRDTLVKEKPDSPALRSDPPAAPAALPPPRLPPPSPPEDATEPMPTQMSSGSFSGQRPISPSAQPAHTAKIVLSVAAGSAVAIALVVVFMLVRSGTPGPRVSSATATPVPTSSPPATGSTASAPSAAGLATTSASSWAVVPVPSPSSAAAMTSSSATAPEPARPAATAPHPRGNPCNPPYATDSSGYRHYKRECMK
jgi:serine/threonine-protein kinase